MGRLLPLHGNIRLGWKLLTVTNTLAYYDVGFITAVKGYLVISRRQWRQKKKVFLNMDTRSSPRKGKARALVRQFSTFQDSSKSLNTIFKDDLENGDTHEEQVTI